MAKVSKVCGPEVYVVKHTKVGSVLAGGEFGRGEVFAPTIDVDYARLVRLGAIERIEDAAQEAESEGAGMAQEG